MGKVLRSILRFEEKDQTVLDFLLGLKDLILILNDQSLKLRIRVADLVGDLTIIENIPLDRRPKAMKVVTPGKHVAQTVSLGIT